MNRPRLTSGSSAAEVRTGVRDWLRETLPQAWLDAVDAGDDAALRVARQSTDVDDLVRRVGAAGLSTPDWAVEHGGLGLGRDGALAVAAELRAHRVPGRFNPIGLGMAAPTILRWGTDEQKRHHLPGLADNSDNWCQLFSEPGAGSDLSSLATRAVRDGAGGATADDSDWIVNGQKVWTSMAHVARYAMLLARTDPAAPKHRGITYFILDMSSPGIEVRPLRQLTGEAEFNEVWLTDVRVPDSARLGPVDEGWTVARTTLVNERNALSGASGASLGGSGVDALLRAGAEVGAWDDPVLADRMASVLIDAKLLRAGNARAARARAGGDGAGPEGSITKLFATEHNKRMQGLAVAVAGLGAVAWEPGSPQERTVRGFLRAQANSIEGGTSEIQRNLIAERILGLPREADPSRDVPWQQMRRSG
ncbi:MAG TPA: acyl-CoA dehydrogenase family protein [Pseudonocardia sp.]|jgi:alkylation response protein AidB-like acyl-CoA dehydrogenase|nr:acyl-CoA dehydrogenase family protein [Pseudonocardia sp.]